MTTSCQTPLVCSVGVTAYNEEENIGPLLAALLDQHLHRVEIAEIIVVAALAPIALCRLSASIMATRPAHQAHRAGAPRGQDQRRQSLPQAAQQ